MAIGGREMRRGSAEVEEQREGGQGSEEKPGRPGVVVRGKGRKKIQTRIHAYTHAYIDATYGHAADTYVHTYIGVGGGW